MVAKLYHAALRIARQKHTVTYQLQRWQKAEPLVFIIAAIAAGIWLGRHDGPYSLLHLGAAFGLGALLGHLFWGGQAKQ